MRLLEAILDANRRRATGDRDAKVGSACQAALPLAALTCIDPRLNRLLPDALGVEEEHFIWLRNAGNIITNPLSSTMRSLALACAVKGAKEIVVIGHSDCLVCKTSMMQLLDRLSAFGVKRERLPENLVEYFGLFSSERQNVMRGVEFVRGSPLIGANIPVHGLIIDLPTGKLDVVTSGYDAQTTPPAVGGKTGELLSKLDRSLQQLSQIGHIVEDELKVPATQIGDVVSVAQDWLRKAEHVAAAVVPNPAAGSAESTPPPVPAAKVTDPLKLLQQRMNEFNAAKQATRGRRKR